MTNNEHVISRADVDSQRFYVSRVIDMISMDLFCSGGLSLSVTCFVLVSYFIPQTQLTFLDCGFWEIFTHSMCNNYEVSNAVLLSCKLLLESKFWEVAAGGWDGEPSHFSGKSFVDSVWSEWMERSVTWTLTNVSATFFKSAHLKAIKM